MSSISLTASVVNTSGCSLVTHMLSSILIAMPRKCDGHLSSSGTYTPLVWSVPYNQYANASGRLTAPL